MIIWISGQSKSGKTTLARELASKMAVRPVMLDGDAMRLSVSRGLGFTAEDRLENNTRIALLAKELERQGHDVIVSTVCPTVAMREAVTKIADCRWIILSGGVDSMDFPFERCNCEKV